MKHLTLPEVENYLYKSIAGKIDIGYSAGFALERVKYTMNLLGNPQEQLKIIHVAGTSGKGSTVSFISQLLKKHGFKTGHTISPHLVDIRERVQINNKPITREQFANYFSELLPVFKKVEKTKYGSVSYFEMLMILAYYVFHQEGVDYAVVETGLGGTFDASNCVGDKDKLCVITRIGKDHTHILGNTITEIAQNKAGIVNEKQRVVYIKGAKFSDEVIKNRAKEMRSENFAIDPSIVFEPNNSQVSFSFLDTTLENLPIQDLPSFQVENLTLALSALSVVSGRDHWEVNRDLVSDTIREFSFPGRFEILRFRGKTVVLDGAHNPQKMSALIKALREKFPKERLNFVVAFKEDKDSSTMLDQIKNHANSITITSFKLQSQDIKLKSADPQKLKLQANSSTEVTVTTSLEDAVSSALKKDGIVVVTGSLYLIAQFKTVFRKPK